MKKIFYVLLLLAAVKVNAQDAVVFKMKYQPGHKYSSVLTMGMDLNVNMTGNEQMAEKLKAQGITMPLALKAKINLDGDITTGKIGADGAFPLTVNFSVQDLVVDLAGNEMEPLKGKNIGIKIYGHDLPDGKIKADSSVVNNKKDTAQKAISGMLNSLQNQIKFPDRPLKVGDTFTQEAPMNLPMTSKINAGDSKTIVKSTYKLTSIADGKAYFDVTQTLDIEVDVKMTKVVLTGDGSGKLVYLVKDNFPASFNDTINMKLNVTAGTTVVDGTAVMTLASTHTIN
jgi:hypothetical protein